jgi:hypothetical protein
MAQLHLVNCRYKQLNNESFLCQKQQHEINTSKAIVYKYSIYSSMGHNFVHMRSSMLNCDTLRSFLSGYPTQLAQNIGLFNAYAKTTYAVIPYYNMIYALYNLFLCLFLQFHNNAFYPGSTIYRLLSLLLLLVCQL